MDIFFIVLFLFIIGFLLGELYGIKVVTKELSELNEYIENEIKKFEDR